MGLTTSPLFITIFCAALCLIRYAHAEEGHGPGLEPEVQEEEYMRPMHMSDFMSDSQLAKRANDFTQLDGRLSDTLLWGKEVDSRCILLF